MRRRNAKCVSALATSFSSRRTEPFVKLLGPSTLPSATSTSMDAALAQRIGDVPVISTLRRGRSARSAGRTSLMYFPNPTLIGGGVAAALFHSLTMKDIIKWNSSPVDYGRSASIDLAIDTFIAQCNVREQSRRHYRKELRIFFEWVASTGRPVQFLTRADIIAFKDSLLRTHSNLTIASYLVSVRRFYEWAEGYKLYPNIAKGIKSPKRKNAFLKEHLRERQIADFLHHYEENSRNYAIVNLLLRTGIRTIELVRANVEDITFKGGQRILKVWGKGHDEKDSFVVLTNKAYAPIQAYLSTRKTATQKEPLFTSTSNRNQGGRLTTKTISTLCKDGFRAIGLDGKEFTAHSLRHTTAVMLLKHGTLQDVQSVLRHQSPATSQIYTKSVEEELRLEHPSELKLDNAF